MNTDTSRYMPNKETSATQCISPKNSNSKYTCENLSGLYQYIYRISEETLKFLPNLQTLMDKRIIVLNFFSPSARRAPDERCYFCDFNRQNDSMSARLESAARTDLIAFRRRRPHGPRRAPSTACNHPLPKFSLHFDRKDENKNYLYIKRNGC